MADSKTLSQKYKNQVQGEMLFLRAMVYFYMVNYYGNVPLVLSTNYLESSVIGRTDQEIIYQQIISDLQLAQQLLIANYPSIGKTRPNLYTATALLARVYLFHKDYKKSSEMAELVINSNIYTLTTDLSKTFLINSTETIWEIAAPAESRNTAEGSLFVPSSSTARPTFAVSDVCVNAFDNVDKRKATWLSRNINAGVTYYYPSKYKNRLTTSITEYEVVFRLAEQHLIRAECYAQLDEVATAVTALNKTRTRAGLPDVSASITKQGLLDAILKERQKEFVAEWGHRWFDLKRLNLLTQLLVVEKPGFQTYMQWYPIPAAQLIYNPYLTQNEGYY